MLPRAEYDIPWKKILELYLRDFLELCCPIIHKKIDWQNGYYIRDNSLHKIFKDAVKNSYVDKLIQVSINNSAADCLIHIEVQSAVQINFAERMFHYRCGLQAKYNLPIISIAILADNNRNWRPESYSNSFFGVTETFNYILIKILDYRDKTMDLENSLNPFSLVILAQLVAIGKQDVQAKFDSKLCLLQILYNRNYTEECIINLFIFIDWVIVLPPKFELEFNIAVQNIEEWLKVRYVTSIERWALERGLKLGLQQGIEQGMQNAFQSVLFTQLHHKFKNVPDNYITLIKHADAESILKWARLMIDRENIEEIFIDC